MVGNRLFSSFFLQREIAKARGTFRAMTQPAKWADLAHPLVSVSHLVASKELPGHLEGPWFIPKVFSAAQHSIISSKSYLSIAF